MSKSWGEIRDEALRRCGQKPPQTNADRIRAMSDEELAAWLSCRITTCPPGVTPSPTGCDDVCDECWLDWLRAEAVE